MTSMEVYKDALTIIVPIVTMALGVQAWFFKMLGDARKETRDLEDEVHQFKEQVARENVTNATLEKFETRLVLAVDKLGDRLDRVLLTSNTTIVKT